MPGTGGSTFEPADTSIKQGPENPVEIINEFDDLSDGEVPEEVEESMDDR